jgi:hypothetical protein
MYERTVRTEVSQGDILLSVPIGYNQLQLDGTVARASDGSVIEPVVRIVPAMLLSRDCVFDNTSWAIVAEIRPLTDIDIRDQGNVRQYRSKNVFYLPKLSGVFEESFVDLRRIDRLQKAIFLARVEEGVRVASLTDRWQLALQFQIALFFGMEEDRLWHPTIPDTPEPDK